MEIHDNENVQKVSSNPHDWNAIRFKTLGAIRNESMIKTLEYGCDYYFVVDCDNFIIPETLKDLVIEDKPIIGPLLTAIPEKGDMYSNYFCDVDDYGYYRDHEEYEKILFRIEVGVHEVPVIHCTYLIKQEFIPKLNYVDGSDDYEFVIFSKSARKNDVKQYISNKKHYGNCIHFFDDRITLEDEAKQIEASLANIPQLII